MYEAFFRLKKRPFSATPDATCCYMGDSVTGIVAELMHCVEAGQGIGILTGAAGTGKTLLCRRLVADFGGQFKTALIGTGNLPTRRALLQAILYELQHPYSGMSEQELRLELISAAKSLIPQFEGTLLILDEAHLLSERLLEEVRIISDFSQDGVPLIRVAMSGQLQLEEKLTSAALEAFNQRVASQVVLEPMTREQTLDYIEHRLNWAGGNSAEVFTTEALALIAQACDGLPRCVNQLCDHCLLLAFVSDVQRIDAHVVEDALADLKQLPLHWNTSVLSAGPLDALSRKDADFDEQALDDTHRDADDVDSTWEAASDDVSCENGASFEVGAEFEQEEAVSHTLPISRSVEQVASGSDRAEMMKTISIRESRPAFEVRNAETEREDASSRLRIPGSPLHDAPAEELIFDRYAMLDAGKTMAGQIGQSSQRPFGLHAGETYVFEERNFESEPQALHRDSRNDAEATPEKMVDVVLSLLDHAEERPSQPAQSESEIHSRKGFVGHTNAPSDASRSSGLRSVEESIANDVLDVCLDAQHAIESRVDGDRTSDVVPLDDRDSDVTHRLDPAPRAIRFDVVEPEGAQPGTGITPSGVVPRPNYKLIFSTLRRRQKRNV